MFELKLNILDFIDHLNLLDSLPLSLAQRTCLKSIYGLSLDGQEFEIYTRATGRQTCDPQET